jgi:hypothetical protein
MGCGGESGEDAGSNEGGEGGGSSGGTAGTGGSAAGGSSGGGGFSGGTGCDVPTDCVLVPASCCVCGMPELPDVTAVNVASQEEYLGSICGMGPACGCPIALNPNLAATCDAGTCRAVDVREHVASECADDRDCRVRVSQCCECGGDTSPGALIAVNSTLEYEELVCDPLGLCADCAPSYPTEASAHCASNHCELVDERL